MKLVMRSLAISMMVAIFLQPCMARAYEQEEERNHHCCSQSTASFGKKLLSAPFILGKNVTGMITVVGGLAAVTAAAIWVGVSISDTYAKQMAQIIAQQPLLERSNPSIRQDFALYGIELLKNIEATTLITAGVTAVAAMLHSTFVEILE